nr:hypothetical protein [uncultured Flavobacterium sp.]
MDSRGLEPNSRGTSEEFRGISNSTITNTSLVDDLWNGVNNRILNATRICFSFHELFGNTSLSSAFGYMAEPLINFLLTSEFSRLGVSPNDLYQDYSFAGPIDLQYIGFLMLKNPTLASRHLQTLRSTPHKRPDILIHTSQLQEYYEIKPDSLTGRRAGRSKLAILSSNYTSYALPYVVGASFNPPTSISLGVVNVPIDRGFLPAEISFSIRRDGGLILYKICINANWAILIRFIVPLLRAIYDLLRDLIRRINQTLDGMLDKIKEHSGEIEVTAEALAIIIILLDPVLGDEVAIPPILSRAAPTLYNLIIELLPGLAL